MHEMPENRANSSFFFNFSEIWADFSQKNSPKTGIFPGKSLFCAYKIEKILKLYAFLRKFAYFGKKKRKL